MSNKHEVAVLQIAAGQLPVSEAARRYGINRQHLHRLLVRFRKGGLAALESRSRRPGSNPNATGAEVRESLRLAGRMHHLGIGRAHARERILAIADARTITVVRLDTGEVIATNQIDPARDYWRNTLPPASHRPK